MYPNNAGLPAFFYVKYIKFHFIWQKMSEHLHMCNFCCIFAAKLVEYYK